MWTYPNPEEYVEFYAGYIRLVPEGSLLPELLSLQGEETHKLFSSLTEEQGGCRYAPDKWSLRQVLGHIVDNERIMSYRLLRIARGDLTPLPGYDQDLLVPGADFDEIPLAELLDYYMTTRRATLSLLRIVPKEGWARSGEVSGYKLSVRSLAAIIAGHEAHHLQVVANKYLPVLPR